MRATYLKNFSIGARALTLLLPDGAIDEDDVDFDVSFVGFNVPSPVALVRSYMEANELPVPKPRTPKSTPVVPAQHTGTDFVFGDFNGDFIILPRSVAEKWARMQQALNTCTTWGELRGQAPADLYSPRGCSTDGSIRPSGFS
jgi:hypothetical protein